MHLRLFGKDIIGKAKAPEATQKQQPEAYGGSYRYLGAYSYTGEKNMGEMGPVKDYICDHAALRARSWQLFLDSEICQTVFKRFDRWVIGSGLKLQAEPNEDVLKSEGIAIKTEEFNSLSESRFDVFSSSKMSDYANMRSLHKLASRAFKDAIVGGDVLVVLRAVNKQITVQLIDGDCLATPYAARISVDGSIWTNGNRIKYGVEIDATGKHVAYHVRTGPMAYERIEARGKKSGELMAFLVYGLEYRLDDVRGIPLIAAVMETSAKMDRYKEATLGTAEERAKIALSIEHTEASTGENPFMTQMAAAMGSQDMLPKTIDGEQLANKVTATTNKQAVNLPTGASLKTIESKNELYFGDFFTVNIGLVCATVGIPPDVAMMDYKSNYSASRAAIKDWEHSLNVDRTGFAAQFYQPIYDLWLSVQVMDGKVPAPGYIGAIMNNKTMAVEAYRRARWVGANVPHIDPLKEVQAEREKLGVLGTDLPLTTLESATEALNGGNAWHNIKKFASEIAEAKDKGVVSTPPTSPDG